MGITACLDQVCLGMTFYVLPKRSIYCRLRVIVWNLVKFLVTLLLFRTVLVFAQSRKIIEVCFFFFFGVLRWVFIFLNKCPMTVISYHTAPSHIDHLEWSGYPITPRLSHQLWSASPSTPYQQDKKKNSTMRTCQNTAISINYNDGYILPLDKAQRGQKHETKMRTKIQLQPMYPTHS